MQLTNRGPAELSYPVSNERISTGLTRLDHMLSGGYHRGSNVLISGAPGTAKSTLAGLFAAAACARGDRTLYVSFDEGAAQIVRNLRSVNVKLEPFLRSGVLRMYSTRTRGPNVEDQFGALRLMVREFGPRCLVIDPLSALSTKLAHIASADAAQQFLDFLKAEGITVVNTSLLDGLNTDEATATGISTIADTWIHLSYLVQDGERNRALTIVKSRGTGHSNQVRELKLSNDGVTLTDVFVAQGRVLMGVARWEWEQEETAAAKKAEIAATHRRLTLQTEQAEAAARLLVVKTEMAARDAEMGVLAHAAGCVTPTPRCESHAGRAGRRAAKRWTTTGSRDMSAPKRRPRLSLRLYVAGNAPNSLRAIENLRSICEANFANDYEIEIVDLVVQPARALEDSILVTPTLVRRTPLPLKRLVGNLSADALVLSTLRHR
jgi:KaiC/GvpD/RAD55 family RecA-like ATPase